MYEGVGLAVGSALLPASHPAEPTNHASRRQKKKDNTKKKGWYTYLEVVAEEAVQGKTSAGEGGTLARRSLLQKVKRSIRSWGMGI